MSEQKENNSMEYRLLGGSGLKVSVLGFGAMTFNDVQNAKELISVARKSGINLFDNAELYGQKPGESEAIFGTALKELEKEDPILYRRSDLVITTKLFLGGMGLNEKGLSRKHVMEGINNSLKRLKLDYVDIVFALRFDTTTSMLDIVQSFTDMIRSGKAFYWGTSEWTAMKICEAHWVAKAHGLIAPIVEQPQYNMLVRENIEKTLLDLYPQPYGLGLTTWSPLYGGFLTGKYAKEQKEKIAARESTGPFIGHFWSGAITKASKDNAELLNNLINYAEKKLHSDITTLALAWVIKNRNVSTMLLGASKPSQLEKNIQCIALAKQLTNENLKEIDEILGNKPILDQYQHGTNIKETLNQKI